MAGIARLIGVYHADGGVLGELRYAVGKITRNEHCELCDLTHRGVRRRSDWDAMVGRVGVPFDLVHLNERSEAVRRASHDQTPSVLVEVDGEISMLLPPEQLRPVGKDVDAFESILRRAVDEADLTLP